MTEGKKRKCIVVLGMHRSGTSAVAGFLANSGIFFGNILLEAQEDNLKGFFENKALLQINENILKILGSSWDDINELPEEWYRREEITIFKLNIKEVIKNELNNDVCGVKDPRISILLPLYLEVFDELKIEPLFLVVKRKKIEICKSLEKRNNFSYEKSLALSRKYEESIKKYTKQYTKFNIFFDDVVYDVDSFCNNLQKIFEIKLNIDIRSKSFLEKNLKHHNISYGEIIKDYKGKIESMVFVIDDNKKLKYIIAEREENISNKERHIDELSRSMLEHENQMAIARQEIVQCKHEIKILKASLSWRFSQRITKLFFIIFSDTYKTRRLFENFIRFLHKVFKKKSTNLVLTSKKPEELVENPLISIIMPTYNTDVEWLRLAIASVKKQTYENWELCIADDGSTNGDTLNFLKHIDNKKIKVNFLKENRGIAYTSNEAIKMCQGEYVGFLDHDDELTTDALYEVAKAINNVHPDVMYSDEDKIDSYGKLIDVHHKPTFSPDLLLSQNYMCHFTVIKKTLIEKIGAFNGNFNGSQDYDLFLRVAEVTNNIFHISKVLYHWRQVEGSTSIDVSNKTYAVISGKKAIEEALIRRGIQADVLIDDQTGYYRVKRRIIDEPLVSIIIPFKNELNILKKCINSILVKTTYKNYEILAIDNSSDKEGIEDWKKIMESENSKIQFISYNKLFNYSAINNYAVGYCKGEHLIFLNNDIEVINGDWIEALMEHSQRSEVGVVGAKLYYPDDTIQHAGVIIGMGGVAGHAHKRLERENHGYFARASIIQNISAVTGACMMIKKNIFNQVGGFDESLAVAFNDVDICLRVRELGYLNVYTPYAELYHHESYTRGSDFGIEKQERFQNEVTIFSQKHSKILQDGDPYFNPNLDLMCEVFTINNENI